MLQLPPFYTGKQKILDTGGRVARFEARYAKKKQPDDRAPAARTVSRTGAVWSVVRVRREPERELRACSRPSRGCSPSTPSSSSSWPTRHCTRTRRAARRLGQRYAELTAIVTTWHEWLRAGDDLAAARELAAEDASFAEEATSWPAEREPAEERLRRLLVPRDPADDKDAILEIKSGEGGEESALFAGDLLRMYTRYAERPRLEDRDPRRHRVRPRRVQVASRWRSRPGRRPSRARRRTRC